MTGYAWVLEVRPGYEEEYRERHDEIWPEMLEALRAAGISNYNIFRHGLTLFGARAASTLAIYEHDHDHTHLPDGRVRHADGTITDHCHPGDGHHPGPDVLHNTGDGDAR